MEKDTIQDINKYTLFNTRRKRVLPELPERLAYDTGENVVINVDDLHIDHSYQRPLDPHHVEKIANNFDLKKIFRIAVNQRPNGKYYIIDGQQRVSAAKLLGGNFKIDCVLYHLETIEEEAHLYYYLNWDRKNTNAMDRWKALLAQKEPDILHIQKLLDDAELRLTKGSNAPRSINSVGAINAWTKKDIEALAIVIMILGKLEYFTPVGSEVITGLCVVEHHLREHGLSLTRARTARETFAQYLVSKGYTIISEASRRYQSERIGLGGGSTSIGYKAAKGIIQLMNYKLKTGHLPLIGE